MPFAVSITHDAARDLADLYAYIDKHDVPGKADHVLREIEKVLKSLSEKPHRGVHPGELTELGIREYRELFFKPYRIIYRVVGNEVFVMLIVDGRRDMKAMLERRMLAAD